MAAPVVSFAVLLERHRPEVLAYLVRLLGDEHDAQDACQDACLRAYRAFGRLAPDSNFRAWLYRIATRCGLNAARRRARGAARRADLDLDAVPGIPGASPDVRDRLRRLARAVEALPPRQRAALMLRQFQGLGYADIAASVGGSEAGARANVYQALRKLRTTIGGAA
jgi:RNA polymerase sigma-70 factor (ECF subfamily)